MVDAFRKELFAANPEWLGQEMIDEVTDTVETFVHGYTVGNLTGPQVRLRNLRKRNPPFEGKPQPGCFSNSWVCPF